ncbi:RHS repeat-associated core domain-containing protein [Aeromonas jandaei]|uniref:RHS repeat-associated core domain-containing protein n=1 Tax=Aeromonas jandaei TaxID=650 RepID=UPI00191F828F|nr:RHS repeat-associated core domain-containing protein [Aeromonas jandaei]MBL0612088.1 RHS repeat-associated core domain-containing protein [Aeromonas jandaei]
MNSIKRDPFTLLLPAEHSSSLDAYPNLSRRQFLIKSSIFAAASSLLVLPNALRAADLLPTNSSGLLMGYEVRNQLTIMTNFIGFNGERRDPVTGLYHLGKGERAYNPALMRFHAADSLSPFGDGGLNPYAYTLGNPINLLDPSGHMSVSAGVGLGLGILGLLISIFTLGTGIAAGAAMMTAGTALSITSSVLGIVSSATGIASALTEESNPQASSTLGWISLGTGIVSAATGIGSVVAGAKATTTAAVKSTSSLKTFPISSSSYAKVAADVAESPGRLLAHGAPGVTATKTGLKSGSALAKSLASTTRQAGGVFKLDSCYGAVGGRWASQGQALANKLGTNVMAYPGRYNTLMTQGIVFRPQSAAQAVHTARLNKMLGGISKLVLYIKNPSWI